MCYIKLHPFLPQIHRPRSEPPQALAMEHPGDTVHSVCVGSVPNDGYCAAGTSHVLIQYDTVQSALNHDQSDPV